MALYLVPLFCVSCTAARHTASRSGWFAGKIRTQHAKEKAVGAVVFFIVLGPGLAAYMKIGYAHQDNPGTLYAGVAADASVPPRPVAVVAGGQAMKVVYTEVLDRRRPAGRAWLWPRRSGRDAIILSLVPPKPALEGCAGWHAGEPRNVIKGQGDRRRALLEDTVRGPTGRRPGACSSTPHRR